MDRWIICGNDMGDRKSDGLLEARNCPSFDHTKYFARQGKRVSNTKKISLKEKKSHLNVEQKVCSRQQNVVSLQKRIQGGLFQKNNLRNFYLEKRCKKIIFHQTVPELKDEKRMDLYSRNIKQWNIGRSEVKENKREILSQKITISYINSNNHVPLNPEYFQNEKKTNSTEIGTMTQHRYSITSFRNIDEELKISNDFIFPGSLFLRKVNSSQAIMKPYSGESCQKQAKNLDQLQFCKKAESLADSEEQKEQFSLVLEKLDSYGMQESLMKEPSTPDTVSSEFYGFGI